MPKFEPDKVPLARLARDLSRREAVMLFSACAGANRHGRLFERGVVGGMCYEINTACVSAKHGLEIWVWNNGDIPLEGFWVPASRCNFETGEVDAPQE